MKDTGKKTNSTEKAKKHGQMEPATKETTLMAKRMDLEGSNGPMGQLMRVNS